MRFSYEWIQELSGTSLSPEEAAALLSAKLFEAEVGEGGDVLEIDVLPNRPDCLSHLGIARELCALEGRRFIAPSYEYDVAEEPRLSIDIHDTEGCPRFSALVVRNVNVGPSPSWLKERLERLGLRSINNVVDVTNYVMLELGQPMHAFDRDVVNELVIRRAHEGEHVAALDEARTDYELDGSMLVVADRDQALSIAGMKGGAGSGISDTTTDVLLEAANWRPEDIRATSRRLDLRTDASIRFSYGVDPNLTAPALVRAGQLLERAAEGQVDGQVIDVYPQPRTPRSLKLEHAHVRRLLGAEIQDAQVRTILETLGFEIASADGFFVVSVPTRRSDVEGPEDLIEEVGRVYGYDAIPSEPPVIRAYDNRRAIEEDVEGIAWDEYGFVRERDTFTHLLAGAGYSEVSNYVFLSDELADIFGGQEGLHELEKPQSSDYRWLRRSLIPRLLVNARDNLRFWERVQLFETGHIFDRVDQGREATRLALVLAQRSTGKRAETFYELKGAVDLLLRQAGVTDWYYDDADPVEFEVSAAHSLTEGERATIRLDDGTSIGCIGVVNTSTTNALKLKGCAAVAELDLRILVQHAQSEREFAPLPKYPAVIRDVAVLVSGDTKIGDIIQTIHGADTGSLVRDVDVFDIFVPTGKEKLKAEGDTPEYGKSIAFHITFRADDRTLRDEEVQEVEEAIKKELQEKLDARIR